LVGLVDTPIHWGLEIAINLVGGNDGGTNVGRKTIYWGKEEGASIQTFEKGLAGGISMDEPGRTHSKETKEIKNSEQRKEKEERADISGDIRTVCHSSWIATSVSIQQKNGRLS
jgi:hypothetical protein